MSFIIRMIERCVDWEDQHRINKCLKRCEQLAMGPKTDRAAFVRELHRVFFADDTETLADEFVDLQRKLLDLRPSA